MNSINYRILKHNKISIHNIRYHLTIVSWYDTILGQNSFWGHWLYEIHAADQTILEYLGKIQINVIVTNVWVCAWATDINIFY